MVASIRSGRAGSKMEHVANVGVEGGLVVLDLALEGDEDEEDRVWVYLTDDQNKWMIEALRKAME